MKTFTEIDFKSIILTNIYNIVGDYMKKSEIKEIISSAIKPADLCRVYFKYDENYYYYFPLQTSEKLFLGVEEDDFILDGFSVRRFCDVKKVELKNDKCIDIIRAEGILNSISVPEIDLTDWHSTFLSLQRLDKNVIVERDSLSEDDYEFYIGRIEKVLKTKILFRHFDADGVWQDEPYEIPFSKITSVTFDSRYVSVFSKYV